MKIFIFLLFCLQLSYALADDLEIIVNEKNPVTEISPEQISDYFFKRNRSWPNGMPVRFFDHRDESDERKVFLSTVLRKTSREIELFWIGQKLYTGNSAPLQITSDTMTASLVARFPGAIGYVSSTFPGAPGVKKIAVKRD